jgi:hypothetical protein
MTSEEKKNINSRINELMGILSPTGSITDCVMYIHGDAEHQNASFSIHGDANMLVNTIHHHMTANEEFRRFMLAMLGSYLSGNPEVEMEFLNGLLVIKNNLGIKFQS